MPFVVHLGVVCECIRVVDHLQSEEHVPDLHDPYVAEKRGYRKHGRKFDVVLSFAVP